MCTPTHHHYTDNALCRALPVTHLQPCTLPKGEVARLCVRLTLDELRPQAAVAVAPHQCARAPGQSGHPASSKLGRGRKLEQVGDSESQQASC